MDHTDKPNEPLASRLRDAAIERTTTDAERVDDFILDADGVIDLRDLERDTLGASVADPAKALATIRGQLGDAHEVDHLYDDSEPDRSRWRLGLRARHVFSQQSATAVKEKSAATVVPAPTVTPSAVDSPSPDVPPTLNRLSMVPVVSAQDPAPKTDPGVSTDDEIDLIEIDLTEAGAPDTSTPATSTPAKGRNDPDRPDHERPTADCPKCMGLGHRDLFDRFSQVEFYSCDHCMHMWQRDIS